MKENNITNYKAVADYRIHVTDTLTVEAFGYQTMKEESGTEVHIWNTADRELQKIV